MKKGQEVIGIVERVEFPNKGIVKIIAEQEITVEKEITAEQEITAEKKDSYAVVKNCVPGQKISFRINKVRSGKGEGGIFEVIEKSPLEVDSPCPHFGTCGGCNYQNLPYQVQLSMKEEQVKKLLAPVLEKQEKSLEEVFEPIKGSPIQYEYRNKMEFSFGDEIKDGPLALGMHKRGSFYDVVSVCDCQIVDGDYRKILEAVLEFFQEKETPFFHRMHHIGYLRHLLVRKAKKTGEILIALVTSTQQEVDLQPLVDKLLSLEKENFSGKIAGILHTKNDSVADVVKSDETIVLYGQDYFYEELLNLKFKISQFSFFQTNTLGAEVLYETTRDYLGDISLEDGKRPVVFDLYSGTGTIAQLIAPVCSKVIGVEIVEEAVEAAKKNAELNGLHNCEFVAGDVLKVIDDITEKPDFIILDPPRDGIHPRALQKIIDYGAEKIVYVSCKPTSLARDLEVFLGNGYRAERITAVDMFPGTTHVECVVKLEKR